MGSPELPQIAEIVKLTNSLNSAAAQLSAAKKDLANAETRITASEESLLVIQHAIVEKLREIGRKSE